MDVSVIIVNYNTKEMTQNCIDSIFKHTKGVSFEIILVDNASTDGSKEYFKQDKRIKYIYSSENLGFGKANNLGYEHAIGKYLFLLNSDTILLNNAIDLFYKEAECETNKSIGCWGTMLYDSNHHITGSYGRFLSLWRDLFTQSLILPLSLLTRKSLSFFYKEYNYKTSNSIVDFISGADLFMKKSIADKFGLFDPNYFLYCEETDMQKRYAVNNIYSKIIESPKIIHFQGGSQQCERNVKSNLIKLKSKMYYFRKWNNKLAVLTYSLILSPIRFVIFLLTRQEKQYMKQYFKILWNN